MKMKPSQSIDRRTWIKAATTASLSTLTAAENQAAGNTDWQLTRVKLDKTGGFRSPFIEGYCSHQSITAGETLQVFVSTKPASDFTIEIFRMGYYGGSGARLMRTLGPLQGKPQPDPPIGEKRLRDCAWEPSAEIKVPSDWKSGVYLGRLTCLNKPGWQSYVTFVIKDHRKAGILFQVSDNTWQAYNRWPDNYSLYTDPRGSLVGGVDVSCNRPYGKYSQIFEAPQSVGSGEFLLWEFPLCYWLEQQGYDVTYCSNSDMLDPGNIERAQVFVSVGHDEYWDPRQYQTVKVGIEKGVSALFLSGNSVCFVAPYRAAANGVKNRIITRAGRYGGLTEVEKMQMGPFDVDGPNENLLIGARTIDPFNGGGDWIVTKPDHWVFKGTGMKKGDFIPGLVGWEFHGDPGQIPSLEVIAEGDALNGANRTAHWTATIYPGPKRNFVFNASTIWWSQGLSSPPGHMLPWSHWVRPHGPDPRVQRITANLFSRALKQSK